MFNSLLRPMYRIASCEVHKTGFVSPQGNSRGFVTIKEVDLGDEDQLLRERIVYSGSLEQCGVYKQYIKALLFMEDMADYVFKQWSAATSKHIARVAPSDSEDPASSGRFRITFDHISSFEGFGNNGIQLELDCGDSNLQVCRLDYIRIADHLTRPISKELYDLAIQFARLSGSHLFIHKVKKDSQEDLSLMQYAREHDVQIRDKLAYIELAPEAARKYFENKRTSQNE